MHARKVVNHYILTLTGAYAVVLSLPLVVSAESLAWPAWWAGGVVVALFLLVAAVALLSGAPPAAVNRDRASVSVLIPVLNEEEHIGRAIRSVLAGTYPAHLTELIVINDGSTDGTVAEVRKVQQTHPKVKLLDYHANRGKREALQSGLEQAGGDLVLFLDSDTVLEPDALARLVASLGDETDAVCGEVLVANAGANLTTRLQEFDYFLSYNFFKAFESRFGVVTCAPGCLSLFRRSSLDRVLDDWDDQSVLGKRCSYGEDRFLTTLLLREGRIAYCRDAVASTMVPDSMSALVRQRLRWARSWFTNTLLVGRFMYRKPAPAAIVFYVVFLSTLLVPAWLGAAVWMGTASMAYHAALLGVLGLIEVAVALVLGRWRSALRAPVYFLGYLGVLLWLMPVAVATITDNTWGSRKVSR